MMYLKWAIAIIAVGAFLYYANLPQKKQTASSFAASPASWDTKTDARPPVTVSVTPLEFGKGAAMWTFRVVLDTHSGSLDDDLLAAAALIDENGNEYRPTAWGGAGPGGHHHEEILSFTAIQPTPSVVKLAIRNVGGVPERSFAWEVR